MIRYSPSTKGFYSSETHISFPDDSVEVSDQDHRILMAAQSAGKIIKWNADSRTPEAIDAPALPESEKIKQAIALLEATVTPRRIREALLRAETPEGWLASVDAQIAALREQL